MTREFTAKFSLEDNNKQKATFTLQSNKVNASFAMTPVERDHSRLVNRDISDQHTIGSITGLQDKIDEIEDKIADISNKSFIFEQGIASNTWVIEHNLGKIRPSITVVDSADTVVGLFNAEYVNDNKVILHFNGEFVGKAYLN